MGAAAAANFLNAVGGTDICAKASKAYLAAVTAGKSAAQATNAAKQAYISAYSAGTRNAPGTACAAAEVNFKSNFGSDKNVVLEAGKAYVGAISSGQSPERAALLAAKAFIANANLGSADSAACTAGAKGFLGSTSGSNNVLTATEAFINSGESGVDPVCTAAAEAYIGGYSQGLRNEEATPCAAAEASFRKNYGSDKNGVLEAALAYMNAAPSTLCGEAGKAYIAAISANPGAGQG